MPLAGFARSSPGRRRPHTTPEQLALRVDPEANSIPWLVWHLTRIQDDHLADAAQADQVWTSQGWVERFGLPFDPLATGYGYRADQVAAMQVDSGELLWATTTLSTSRRPGTWDGSATPISQGPNSGPILWRTGSPSPWRATRINA
jgi:hypothetical protein